MILWRVVPRTGIENAMHQSIFMEIGCEKLIPGAFRAVPNAFAAGIAVGGGVAASTFLSLPRSAEPARRGLLAVDFFQLLSGKSFG